MDTAREYYNSTDADRFYATIWGGEDIHIGLYESENDSIVDASRRTVEKMAATVKNLDETKKAEVPKDLIFIYIFNFMIHTSPP